MKANLEVDATGSFRCVAVHQFVRSYDCKALIAGDELGKQFLCF